MVPLVEQLWVMALNLSFTFRRLSSVGLNAHFSPALLRFLFNIIT